MAENLKIDAQAITTFCRRWRIVEFSLFGSVLRDDYRPDSDIDVLVTFDPAAPWSLFDIVAMQDELTSLFGRTTEVIEQRALRNPFRRLEILRTRKVLYAA